MTDDALTQMLRRAATVENPPPASGIGTGIGLDVMSRVRVDEGRARRWRVFVRLMLGAALLAGVLTAVGIGWALAIQDDTHARNPTPPPRMGLFGDRNLEGSGTP